MSKFYTNVYSSYDKILLRERENGKSVNKIIDFKPSVWIESDKPSEYKTIDGKSVSRLEFQDNSDYREFIRSHSGIQNFKIHGAIGFEYQFISQRYSDIADYKFDDLDIMYIDIETTCEEGFPSIEMATESIICIGIKTNKQNNVVFCLGKYTHPDESVKVFSYDDEGEMLTAFLDYINTEPPDIITGWNVKFFDIPYLLNRIKEILSAKDFKRISPWKIIKQKTVNYKNKDHLVYDIVGISVIDYMELYQKFTYVTRESYSLNNIARIELNETKISYDEYESITEFYKKNFQKFVQYNIQDVELVYRLESKLRLLELAVALAYSAGVNFTDVFSQVKTWDVIIYNYLIRNKIVVPPKRGIKKEEQYAGAYVKDPLTGMHDWVVSFDLNSLYPHIIMQYNISPETKLQSRLWKRNKINPDRILSYNESNEEPPETEQAKKENVTFAANGIAFNNDETGFLANLMESMYEDRKRYKKLMLSSQVELEKLGKDAPEEKRKKLEYDISKYKNFQMVKKIQLNSAYGAIGNEYFRFFDVELAEAITLSGQLSIQWIGQSLNRHLNKLFKTINVDYVIASDTDSVYLRLAPAVKQALNDSKDTEASVDFLNKFSEKIIEPFINKEFNRLAKLMNAKRNMMFMSREVIANKGLWTAKKRYILNVWDSEGIRYTEPKLKIMGIETTRSSTPEIIREELKACINIIMNKTEDDLIEHIQDFKAKFMTFRPEQIAFPRTVNGISTYQDGISIYKKNTPIAVKGALIYNWNINQMKLGKKYKTISDGDKIKFVYLKMPNPFGGVKGEDHVLSFSTVIPKEFDLIEYVNYNTQFEKSFIDPLVGILKTIGWNTEKQNTLESLFD
jgi:DNA polymerase elongation subunit (family B)